MNREILISGLSALGIEPEEEQLCRFADYSALLKEWNQKMNLTAVCDDDGISVKHFLDSVLPLASVELPQNAAVLFITKILQKLRKISVFPLFFRCGFGIIKAVEKKG